MEVFLNTVNPGSRFFLGPSEFIRCQDLLSGDFAQPSNAHLAVTRENGEIQLYRPPTQVYVAGVMRMITEVDPGNEFADFQEGDRCIRVADLGLVPNLAVRRIVQNPDTCLVLELSSGQLLTLQRSLKVMATEG